MAEPTTVLTDYALAALAVLLAGRLRRSARPLPVSRRLWVVAFLLTALGAVVGGTRHAFAEAAAPVLRHHLWSVTYVVLGLANLALLAGVVRAALPPRLRATALGFLVVRFVAYAVLLFGIREVGLVVADFTLTLVLFLVYAVYSLRVTRDGVGAWLLPGILVAAAGALVQAFRVAPLAGFNHNDLFHLIQMGGIALFYRAGLRLHDR